MASAAFGAWLIGQAKRDDWVGLLAHQAASDPRFPSSGDAHAVRAHLSQYQAGGDTFEALDDAEREWGAAR